MQERLVSGMPKVLERAGGCGRAAVAPSRIYVRLAATLTALALWDRGSVFTEETGFRYVVVQEASATERLYATRLFL